MKKLLLSIPLLVLPLTMSLTATAECRPSFRLSESCDVGNRGFDKREVCERRSREVREHSRGAYSCEMRSEGGGGWHRGGEWRCGLRAEGWRGSCESARFNERECRERPYCDWSWR